MCTHVYIYSDPLGADYTGASLEVSQFLRNSSLSPKPSISQDLFVATTRVIISFHGSFSGKLLVVSCLWAVIWSRRSSRCLRTRSFFGMGSLLRIVASFHNYNLVSYQETHRRDSRHGVADRLLSKTVLTLLTQVFTFTGTYTTTAFGRVELTCHRWTEMIIGHASISVPFPYGHLPHPCHPMRESFPLRKNTMRYQAKEASAVALILVATVIPPKLDPRSAVV